MTVPNKQLGRIGCWVWNTSLHDVWTKVQILSLSFLRWYLLNLVSFQACTALGLTGSLSMSTALEADLEPFPKLRRYDVQNVSIRFSSNFSPFAEEQLRLGTHPSQRQQRRDEQMALQRAVTWLYTTAERACVYPRRYPNGPICCTVPPCDDADCGRASEKL